MCSQMLNLRRGKETKMGSSGSVSRVMMSLRSSIENESSTHTSCSTISGENAVRDLGEEKDMYTHMWGACAGALVYIPRPGESIFYFLQGHIEQVEPYVNRDSEMEMPIYDLPSKILCKVLDVQLKVEIQTDEVFAQITLVPESKQDEVSSDFRDMSAGAQKIKPHIYSKILTSSDTSMHGGFSLPKRHADECLPPLDMSKQTPSQEIVVKDLQGVDWHFHHIYRGHPRRHLLTTGWSAFVTSKKLAAGDVCIFLRGRNGDLRIGIRRSAKSRTNSSPSVISSHTMQHGILANAFHAITSGTMFTVYYRPWTCPSGFIVPLNQYMESTMNNYSIGRNFKMQFEDDAGGEQKFGGTIVGVEDVDHVRWPGSKWKCVQVKWDSGPDEHSLPERISPWDVEFTVPNKQKQSFLLTPPKRICLENSSRKLHPAVADGHPRAAVEALPNPKEGVFQGQEATHYLSPDPDPPYVQFSQAKPVSHGSRAKPGRQSQMKGTNDRTGPSLQVSHINTECREAETPGAADKENDGMPGRQKKIKVFGFTLVGTP